ncbi:kinase-like domain-containing protein [Russula dissimulans]|nr:kinase-like domain-containing protein [Russula dissimulans]
MRLYKQKDIPEPRRSTLDFSPSLLLASSGSQNPDRLKRAAEVVSKQISGHKAMVAQFKDMKLPRPPMFSTRPAAGPHPDRPRLLKQGKDKSSRMPPTVSERPLKVLASTVTPKQRSPFSSVSTSSSSPSKPPGLNSEKANPPIKTLSTPRPAAAKHQSLSSPIRSQRQRSVPQPAISAASTPTGAHLPDISATCPPKPVDVDEPILFVPCFRSLEEDPELEDDQLQSVDLMSSFEAQVTRIFGIGLGSVSESEVVRHGEIACPTLTPEVTSAFTLEPMSAIVEWWEPEANSAIESIVATEVKSQMDNLVRCTASAQTDSIQDVAPVHTVQPSLSAVHPATSAARFDSLAMDVPCQPPSSADYGYVSSINQGAFGAVALGIHKQSRRQCVVKAISRAIVQEESVVRAVLAEQRIMRDASGYPFLLGLLASFHDNRGFYVVSEYCRSTLFDERIHMPESCKRIASAELACAVNHLHSLGIVHRDIRLENVMVKNDGHVVLGEFGLAIRLEAPRSLAPRLSRSVRKEKNNAFKISGVCGTLPYMAPEVLCDMEYSYGIDWFAYGVFLHVFYLDQVRLRCLQ